VPARRGRRSFECPNCGGIVRAGAAACPHCGSDERTGWSEEADEIWYEDLGGYDEEEAASDGEAPAAVRVGRALLVLAVVAAVVIVWRLVVHGSILG